MAKELKTLIKLQIQGGAATPAPPVGPALGQHGVNISQFVQQFNVATSDKRGEVVPVVISVFDDRTFTFITKTAPVAEMLKKAAGIEKGSGKPNTEKKGKVTWAQLLEIGKKKLPDLNCYTAEAAARQAAGTAKQMGIEIIDMPN